MTVAVPLADSAVPSVDEELRMLVAGNLAAAVNRLVLGSEDRGGPLSALGFHGPPAIAGDHMLVTALGLHFPKLPACYAYQPIGSIA